VPVLLELPEEEVNQGKLLMYNRAELKTSDHRPVMAMIDIEVLRSDDALRSCTFQRAVNWLGPPDGTVVLSLQSGDEFSDELVEDVVDTFAEFGEIILVRLVYALKI